MKRKTLRAPIVLSFITLAATGSAQGILIPIDEEGKLECIDSKLEKKLGLFTDYENFREARLLQVSDTVFVLEIWHRLEEKPLKVRLLLTVDETRHFQRKVTERIRQQAPQALLNQEGRAKLLVGTVTLSLGYYGWAVPVTLNAQDGKSVMALYMFTSSGGFIIPFLATTNIPVTDAATTLSFYGATRGILHGMLVNGFLNAKGRTARGMIASGLVASIVEAISSFHIADASSMRPGTAEAIGIGGDFGFGWGTCAAHLAGFFENGNERLAYGSTLLGSGVGLLTGDLLANHQPYTRGDAYILRATGILGAYVPLAAVDIADPENEKIYTAASMIGSGIGFGLGHTLARGKDFTTGQGVLITLNELAGGLLGLGSAFLVSSEGDNSTLYLTSSSLGALGGFWLTYLSFAERAQTHARSSSWNINIAPEGLLVLAVRGKTSLALRRHIPWLELDFRF